MSVEDLGRCGLLAIPFFTIRLGFRAHDAYHPKVVLGMCPLELILGPRALRRPMPEYAFPGVVTREELATELKRELPR